MKWISCIKLQLPPEPLTWGLPHPDPVLSVLCPQLHLLNPLSPLGTKFLVTALISRLRFAEQGPRSLPIHTHSSLLKSGSHLSRKSEWLHHPTGRASAVCKTFEMTHVRDLLLAQLWTVNPFSGTPYLMSTKSTILIPLVQRDCSECDVVMCD